MEAERENRFGLAYRIDGRRFAMWLLGLAVLSAVILGPYGIVSWVAGLIGVILLRVLFSLCLFVGWAALFMAGCRQFVRGLANGWTRTAGLWSTMAIGIVLAHGLFAMGTTPSSDEMFGRGLVMQLKMRTDFDAIQPWVASLNPSYCQGDRYVNPKGRYLDGEERPEALKRQDGLVQLELDAEGRPSVRLSWYQGKVGTFGLVIGDKTMKTPPSDSGAYGERRAELRPGVYFWYEEG